MKGNSCTRIGYKMRISIRRMCIDSKCMRQTGASRRRVAATGREDGRGEESLRSLEQSENSSAATICIYHGDDDDVYGGGDYAASTIYRRFAAENRARAFTYIHTPLHRRYTYI